MNKRKFLQRLAGFVVVAAVKPVSASVVDTEISKLYPKPVFMRSVGTYTKVSIDAKGKLTTIH